MKTRLGAALAMLVVAAACGASVDADGVATFDDLGRDHLHAGDPPPQYNSDPPTSGAHAPNWSRCRIHETPIPDPVQVHDLEHGVVVVQYRPDLAATELDSLVALARGLDGYMIVAPRAGLSSPIVVTAWTKMLRLEVADVTSIRDFWLDYAQRGPELENCPFEETSAVDETAS